MSFHYPISGGKAEKAGKTPSDFNSQAIKKGIKVEKEHTPDKRVATGITIDHLTENEKYYDYLDEMEKKMKTAMLEGFYDELEKIAARTGSQMTMKLLGNLGNKGGLEAITRATKGIEANMAGYHGGLNPKGRMSQMVGDLPRKALNKIKKVPTGDSGAGAAMSGAVGGHRAGVLRRVGLM